MDKIDRDSFSSSGVIFGECNVRRLLLADDFALLSSNKSDLQYTLTHAWMKISTTKTEVMCWSRHPVQCSFQTNEVTFQQTKKFKYLGVTFSSDGRQDNRLDTRIGKANAVMRQFCRSIVLKRELCTKVKLSVFRSIFVSILTCGHECWVMIERVRFRVQAAEMGFL